MNAAFRRSIAGAAFALAVPVFGVCGSNPATTPTTGPSPGSSSLNPSPSPSDSTTPPPAAGTETPGNATPSTSP